jgi:hypothetical protein
MSENNNIKPDILENRHLKEDPFILPDNYFDSLENSIRGKIAAEQESHKGIWNMLKPAIGLAASFALILGIGYGFMRLTGSLEKTEQTRTATNKESAKDTSVISEEEVLKKVLYENGYEATTTIMEQPAAPTGDEIEEYLINSDISTTSLVAMEQAAR